MYRTWEYINTINDFIRWTLWFINPEEVMFTEANGWGEHHFQEVDKSVFTEMKSRQLFY
jgi:hypothetical protein